MAVSRAVPHVDVRPRGGPVVPGSGSVPEINLRTYVRAGDRTGVWFFSLDAASPFAVRAARFATALPRCVIYGAQSRRPERWNRGTNRDAAWTAVTPQLVLEVGYDHVTGDRFRHGTKPLRFRPDKAPSHCTLEQIADAGSVSLSERLTTRE